MSKEWRGLKPMCENQDLRIESRRACPELVERGRLKVVQDCVAAYFQPSPFDKLRAGSTGLGSATVHENALMFCIRARL